MSAPRRCSSSLTRCSQRCWLLGPLDPESLIETVGLIGIFAIVFAESGLLIGFFLPGDSLLFTAGFLASAPSSVDESLHLPLPALLVGCFIAAVAGDQVGYLFGRRVGPALFRRPDSRFFKQENVDKAQGFFDRYGAKTIVLARFVPIVRTFAPIVAGVSYPHHSLPHLAYAVPPTVPVAGHRFFSTL